MRRLPFFRASFPVSGLLLGIVCLSLSGQASHAQSTDVLSESAFGAVALSVHVEDRGERPTPNIALRFKVDLDGYARRTDGRVVVDHRHVVGVATTDAAGVATLRVAPEVGGLSSARWFRGEIHADVDPVDDPEVGVTTMTEGPLEIDESLPNAVGTAVPTLRIFDRPDKMLDGFPIWAARNGRTDHMLVLLEGFDLYNRISATDNLKLIAPAADVLRAHGVGILVVNYPDSHNSPDTLAPLATRAVQTAARISGHKVVLAGLSMGGIVGRWALCTAEASGTPLPVSTFMLLDVPNRGANLNPSLQAMIFRYGVKSDEQALGSDAARALLTSIPSDVKWKQVGIGPMTSRMIPVSVTHDTSNFDAFYGRLRAMNDHNGYPKMCRVVAVSNSSRREPDDRRSLLYLWLPYGFSWTLQPSTGDHAAGSLLPPYYCDRFKIERIFGVAGAYLRSAPTFVSNASALDAGPDETPPFDAWYARPDNLPARAHDDVDPGAAVFAVREVLSTAW